MARAATHDPLDEVRKDPRDLLPVPHRFATALGQMGMRRMNKMVDGLWRSKIYWTYGAAPRDAPPSCVDDPPSSGWSSVLVLEDGPNRLVLCPWSLRSYRIVPGSHEWSSMHGILDPETDAEKVEWFGAHLVRKWAECARHGLANVDWDLAARVMRMLGVEPPSEAEVAAIPIAPYAKPPKPPQAKQQGGGEAKAPFKPVKRQGRKGEVLEAILAGKTSVEALTGQFGITRSNLLSQLFLLRRDHGIGYTVSGDQLALQVPEGVEVFAS